MIAFKRNIQLLLVSVFVVVSDARALATSRVEPVNTPVDDGLGRAPAARLLPRQPFGTTQPSAEIAFKLECKKSCDDFGKVMTNIKNFSVGGFNVDNMVGESGHKRGPMRDDVD
ncbi:hypothetical protein PM082_012324 [Marasmius tenuissimus]|nr:hypothetical protein PM082_012324 [Marasmius tenuissimus]